MSKRALITGGTGYIGSRLARALVEAGWSVDAIVRPKSQCEALKAGVEKIAIHEHNGSTAGMIDILKRTQPEVVFHLASMVKAEHCVDDIDSMIESNILFSTQLVEAMLRTGSRNFINTETFWQFYNGTDEYKPVCLYAATKQAFHDILLYYADSGCLNAISLVLYDTYGSEDTRKKLFCILKDAIREGRQIDMTPGEQVVDITHVDDVVAAYIRAADILFSTKHSGFQTYAVTSSQRMSLKQLIDLINIKLGRTISVNWGGKPYRNKEVMNPWVGKPLPGWEPKIPLEVGLRELFEESY